MLTREKNKITYLHFIMSVLVILIHSINNESKFQNLFHIEKGIGQFAVPLFFMLSGFLFFRNAKTKEDVKIKLKNRVYTLFIPFVIWNLIYYVLHLLIKPGCSFSISELINAALCYAYNPAFWFMYQLILLVIISPIIFIALKKIKFMVLFIVLISLTILLKLDIPFINEDAIIYYSFGALFSKLYNDSKINFIDKLNVVFTLVFSICMFLLNRLLFRKCSVNANFIPAFTLSVIYLRLIGSFFIFYFCDLIFSYRKVYKFMDNTFFLYAIHYMIVKALIILMKFFTYKFCSDGVRFIIENIVFILSPIVCVFINYYLSRFLSTKFEKVYMIISGNRKS